MGGVLAFYFSAALFAVSATAATSEASPARSREWLALHYYAKSGKGWETEIRADEKSAGFFLAPTGRLDPEAELLAFRAALGAPRPVGSDADVRCRFPARYAWAKHALPEVGPRESAAPVCPRYDRWRKEIDADSAYLLFASQFMNSPASMYGHTLLQLGRSGKTKGDTILDYVVAYGAETGGAGGLRYVVLGLAGGFPGFFSTVPFYLKIREYNDAESRDLWSYKLKLNPAQLDILLAHLWEVRTVNFPYYFLGKNCSYFLLRLLDLVNPGESLASGLPFWTIPVDTIRALDRRGWIEGREHRPSRAARMFARREQLAGAGERSLARGLADVGDENSRAELQAVAARDPAAGARVLDAAYELARFRLGGNPPTEAQHARERFLLAERTKITRPPVPITVPFEPPEDAHPSNRLGLEFGALDRSGPVRARAFGLFEWRPALHDLIDDSYALDRYGEQEIMTTRVRYDSFSRHFTLDGLELLKVRALAPLDPWMRKVSWRFRLGSGRASDADCEGWRCTLYRAEGGAGATLGLPGDRENILIALAALDVHASPAFRPDYRIGAGPELGLRLRPFGGAWRILGEASWKRYFLGEKRWIRAFSLGQSLALGRRWEARIMAGQFHRNREVAAGVYRFY